MVTAYVNLRRGDSQPGTQTAYRITVRQLEALVRLSEALARMHCRADVQPRHVREARRQGLTLVHFPAQPEPFLTQSTPLKTPKPHSTP